MTILASRNAMPTATVAEVSRVDCPLSVRVQVDLRCGPTDAPAGLTAGQESVTVARFSAQRLGPDLTEAFQGRDYFLLRLTGDGLIT